jgi:hypothetical protein
MRHARADEFDADRAQYQSLFAPASPLRRSPGAAYD